MNEVKPAPAQVNPQIQRRRIFVVEDHALMRKCIVEAINRDPALRVCGEAEDALEAISAIASARPDLVLTDIQLKSSSGFDLIRSLRQHSPRTPLVAMTIFDDSLTKKRASEAGASCFVSKQEGPDRMIEAIKETLWT